MSAATKKASAPAEHPNETPISAFVKNAWSVNDGDMPSAIEALYRDITARPDVLNAILPQVLRAWCREQVGQYVSRVRLASLPTPEDPSRGNRLRSAIATSLFDFPLPGGKRLGDANASEIREGASAYQRTADDAEHKARWLTIVADRVGRKNRAENALTLAQLEAIFEEAKNG